MLALGLLALVPSAALFAVHHSRLFKALGAVVLCYAAGVFIGNIGVATDLESAKTVSTFCVALAIPLLLFSTDVPGWLRSAKPAVLSFALACLAVCLAAWTGGKLFAKLPESKEVAAMLAAVYIGGTPNMSAMAVALNVRQETFLVVNGADMILSSIYLLFLTSIGKKTLGTFLPPYPEGGAGQAKGLPAGGLTDFKALPRRDQVRNVLLALSVSALVAAASAGLSLAALGRLSETFVIMAITTFGIAGSFWPRLHRLTGAFRAGNYLLLVFCAAVGTMTRLGSLRAAGWDLPLYVGLVIAGSIALHYAAAAFFRLDRETVMITSCAAIMSPPFVVIVAAALGNRDAMVTGVTAGLLGYAIANYMGLGVYYLL